MNRALVRLVHAGQGVVTRQAALRQVSSHAWSHALASRRLVPVFPGVAVPPELAGDPATRRRAALAYAGLGAALSHTSALAVWRLPTADTEPGRPAAWTKWGGPRASTEPIHVTTR